MNGSALSPGTLLSGRYRLESVLGRGGMGTVYRACDETLQSAVAIKEMRVEAGVHAQAVEQFRREAQLLARLDHPHLVRVTDFFAEGQRHFLVMALVQGQNLAERSQLKGGPFPVVEVLDWALQLTSVLGYLHAQQPPILFRDLKPANIMLDGAGQVRLIDFGIARALDASTGTFLQGVGSSGYAPLEQYEGAGGTDPRSDIYALGATIFHLLTHQSPPSPIERVSRGSAPPSIRQFLPDLPLALDSLIAKMMELRKEDRWADVAQVHSALELIQRSLQANDTTEDLGMAVQRDFAYFSEGERSFPIQGTEWVIGRQPPAHCILPNPQISRQHLRVVRGERGYTVLDLGSRFGTFVNGRALGSEPVLLKGGDELVLGGVISLRFFDPSETRGGKRVGRLVGVWIDPDTQDVWLDGQPLEPPLSVAQLTLLKLLEARPGVFVMREEVVQAVWPDAAAVGVSEEAVDGLIKRVRARLREAGRDPIEVRRGQGLRLK